MRATLRHALTVTVFTACLGVGAALSAVPHAHAAGSPPPPRSGTQVPSGYPIHEHGQRHEEESPAEVMRTATEQVDRLLRRRNGHA